MSRRNNTKRESVRKEEELLGFARSYLSDAFPNPERKGCPTDDALRAMALRQYEGDESVSDHLTCGSPCFHASIPSREQARAKVRKATRIKRSVIAFGIAAMLVTVAYLF